MNKFTKKQKRKLIASEKIGTILFAGAMAIGCLAGLLFFARPAVSELENRTLTGFPAFTFSSFLDGSWFSGISTWYSDTFPGREKLMKAGLDLKKSYGIQPKEALLSTGNADDLPADDENREKKFTRFEIPDTYIPTEDVENRIMEGTMLKDGAIYSGCYFVQESADAWFDLINSTAKELEGITNVYSVLLPNNSGALLDEADMEQLGGTDQAQEIEYYFSNYSDRVHPVDAMSAVRNHKDEYIYFRTDHHWTADGAWYAYEAFCKEKGIEPHTRDTFESHTYEPFLGSYSIEFPDLELNPDSVTGYVPKGTNDMVYYDADPATGKVSTKALGDPIPAKIFSTEEGYGDYDHYMRFIAGDQGFSVIDNPEIEDGTTCLVVKESYGNCFVPYLVDHYDKVYVVDFRYNSDNLIDFCKENQITDLILHNNIQLIGSTNVVAMYQNLFEIPGQDDGSADTQNNQNDSQS